MVGNTITPILNQKKYNVMAKLLYNVRAYEDTTENWAENETVYPENSPSYRFRYWDDKKRKRGRHLFES